MRTPIFVNDYIQGFDENEHTFAIELETTPTGLIHANEKI